MTARPQRIAVIGAGPIGLEAALFAAQNGFDVRLYEQGRVAENVLSWGHVKLFSPFGMNSSPWGRAALSKGPRGFPKSLGSDALPSHDALLTGREFARRYLQPLSRLPELAGRIEENVAVEAVGRSQLLKGDLIARPQRAADPFQLLLRDGNGERTAEADYVFDCSGTFGNHNWVGAGGIPCVGEQFGLSAANYLLPDILGNERDLYAGKKTLVVGSGYSAATAVVSLAELARSEPNTRAVWVTRSDRTPPITPIENDSLPERARLCQTANKLALETAGPVEWLPARPIRKIAIESRAPGARLDVSLETISEKEVAQSAAGALQTSNRSVPDTRSVRDTFTLTVDRVIANVGYRPDRRLYEELQVDECYATQGPMKLAAALLGETSLDCLAQSAHGAETLQNPEPGLFILGAKSYGRDSRFLMQIGLEQIRDAFRLIGEMTCPAPPR